MIVDGVASIYVRESKRPRAAFLNPTRTESERRKRLIRESWEWFLGRKLHEDDDPEPHADMEGPNRGAP